MAHRNRKPCLICYDIADPRRLQRLHRHLSQCAIPVQYSVFHARMTATRISRLKQEILNIIDPRQDDVRIYYLPERPQITSLGNNGFPQGPGLLDKNNNLLFTDN